MSTEPTLVQCMEVLKAIDFELEQVQRSLTLDPASPAASVLPNLFRAKVDALRLRAQLKGEILS